MTYREWLALNTQVAAEFHHQTYPASYRYDEIGENPPPRQYLWADNRLVIIDTERWARFWCLI